MSGQKLNQRRCHLTGKNAAGLTPSHSPRRVFQLPPTVLTPEHSANWELCGCARRCECECGGLFVCPGWTLPLHPQTTGMDSSAPAALTHFCGTDRKFTVLVHFSPGGKKKARQFLQVQLITEEEKKNNICRCIITFWKCEPVQYMKRI